MDAQEIIILIKKLPIQVVEHVTLKLVSQLARIMSVVHLSFRSSFCCRVPT
jgi:hypothetical protein